MHVFRCVHYDCRLSADAWKEYSCIESIKIWFVAISSSRQFYIDVRLRHSLGLEVSGRRREGSGNGVGRGREMEVR